jgi:biopolymer transport protein ExbB
MALLNAAPGLNVVSRPYCKKLDISLVDGKAWKQFIAVVLVCMIACSAYAQEADGLPLNPQELQQLANEAAKPPGQPQPNTGLDGGLNFLALLVQGGSLMIPIGIMSLIVVAVTIERMIALRRERLFPARLRRGLEMMLDSPKSVDPQEVYQLALRFPSTASTVIESMLEKVGRPISEIEDAGSNACQREADRLYGRVRWLTLASAVTPLIGLLGTVWGMIIAFYDTTQLGAGQNKAEFLAQGVYIALVTTLGGLSVAIPAAIFAHLFEGRITNLVGRIEEQVKRLIPRFERYEGKVRYDLQLQGLVARDRVQNVDSRVSDLRPVPPPTAKPPVRATQG